MRRSQHYKQYDLRDLLKIMHIHNGGGHEGAIGFRLPKDAVNEYQHYVVAMVKKVNSLLP